jgi:hypothetical protein
MNTISMSNVWTAMPINSKNSKHIANKTLTSINQSKNRKVDDMLSLVIKAKLAKNTNDDDRIFLMRASFEASNDFIVTVDQENMMPDESVLFCFIKADLKNILLRNTKKSVYLYINFLWKVSKTSKFFL